jgi:UDPglucose 6-dehydrogenase
MKTIISGYGYVGKATAIVLKTYSQSQTEIQDPALGFNADSWSDARYHFVCVPTPSGNNKKNYKSHDISIVRQAIEYADSKGFQGITVVRSTMSPMDFDLLSDVLDLEKTIVWPEFLRKASFEQDAIQPLISIIGGVNCKILETDLKHYVFSIVDDCRTACMAKMAVNSYLATRLIIANDLRKACDKMNINWQGVRDTLASDPRLGYGHWDQPGHDGEYGFGGGCLPKDTEAMAKLLLDLDNLHSYAQWAMDKNKKLR